MSKKASARTKNSAKRLRTVNKPTRDIRIRMYNVGFGDCFVIFVPENSRTRKVVVDCGSFKADSKPLSGVVGRVIDDLRDADGVARVDLLVATHRHKDHISGFVDPRWSDVVVSEVWMPWTESDDDDLAKKLRSLQVNMALALERAAFRVDATDTVLALNAASNERAMDVLKHGFAGDPTRRYLPTKETLGKPQRCKSLGSKISIFPLGPSLSPEVIKSMTPPASESYLALLGATTTVTNPSEIPEPFGDDWVVESPHRAIDEQTAQRIAAIHEGAETELAIALDQAINNTSLVLLFAIGDTYLLFPGDAQWGTWEEILSTPEFVRLLQKISFYKVGHHGSHNATPISFVSDCLSEVKKPVWAMVPVTPFGQWPEIPRQPLLKAIKQHVTYLVRSDDKKNVQGFNMEPNNWYVEARISVEDAPRR